MHQLALGTGVSFAALQLTIIGVAYVVSQIVGQTKQIFNLIVSPTNAYQNLIIRAYVFAVALGFVCGYAWFHSALNTRADLGAAIGLAMNAGLYAIAGYHLLQSSDQPAPIPTLVGIEPTQPAPILPPVKAGSDSAPIVPVVAETKPAPVVLTETPATN